MVATMAKPRVFTATNATRTKVPLLIGLAGPSGGGKTFSALRLATGMQKVSGGDIYTVDTESRRMLHYADQFKFKHVPFASPFGSLDYLAAIEYCVAQGAGTIIIDSMSHEHEGPGGVLEQHEAELDRIAGEDWKKRQSCTFLAWAKPKQARRRLINSILQMSCNLIFCFRAKEKMKIQKGKEPLQLGWMPIAGEEFVYEMTTCALLLPNAGGVPTWMSDEIGEKMMIKLPQQFRQMLLTRKEPLDESIGEAMARWAAGDAPKGKKSAKESAEAMVKTFGSLGVSREMIEANLGHGLDTISDTEVVTLRGVYQSIKDDPSSRDQFFAPPKSPPDADSADNAPPDPSEISTEADALAADFEQEILDYEGDKAKLMPLMQRLADAREKLGALYKPLQEKFTKALAAAK